MMSFYDCTATGSLTLDTLREIIPQFKHLERLLIPKYLVGTPNEKFLIKQFRDEMKNEQDPTDSVLIELHSKFDQLEVEHY